MIEIRKIYKKDIPALLEDLVFWKNEFLAVSRHRLLAHGENPTASDNDVVLLLAYIDNELLGYMGAFIDKIVLDGVAHKIGWLSTWWVHPKTKGSGIGREILNTMYDAQGAKIGISQFTPSAKRVYDKSGYFVTLKSSVGVKAVLRSNAARLVPQLVPKLRLATPILQLGDALVNTLVSIKLFFQRQAIASKLENTTIEYLAIPDQESVAIIDRYNTGHISPKTPGFFKWLKANPWVEEAPLLGMTQKARYEFSMYDKSFSVYLMKISQAGNCIGFLVLQKRDKTIKVLFAYYDPRDAVMVSNVIKLQAIRQKINEIVCYDAHICSQFKKSGVFLYQRKKLKQSIISKAFHKTNFDDVVVNFGDGDCSFA